MHFSQLRQGYILCVKKWVIKGQGKKFERVAEPCR